MNEVEVNTNQYLVPQSNILASVHRCDMYGLYVNLYHPNREEEKYFSFATVPLSDKISCLPRQSNCTVHCTLVYRKMLSHHRYFLLNQINNIPTHFL